MTERDPSDYLMRRGEAAEILDCSDDTVTNLARRGVLPVGQRTPRGQRKYWRSDVDRVAAERKAKGWVGGWPDRRIR